jgi:hypothetical protein
MGVMTYNCGYGNSVEIQEDSQGFNHIALKIGGMAGYNVLWNRKRNWLSVDGIVELQQRQIVRLHRKLVDDFLQLGDYEIYIETDRLMISHNGINIMVIENGDITYVNTALLKGHTLYHNLQRFVSENMQLLSPAVANKA